MIYLDNAATSYHKPKQVIDAVIQAMSHMGNAGRGAHEVSFYASRMIYDTREMIANLAGLSNPSQVAFTSNSTESLNIAIQGTLCPGDHVITTMREHNSVLRPLYLMEEKGVELTIIQADRNGQIRYEDLEASIQKNTKAVICSHASNLTGDMTDLSRVGSLCYRKGLLFIVDASQTMGIFPISMEEMNIDILCFTGHKSLMGPQGTGGICIREGVRVRPLMAGGSGSHTYLKTHPQDMPEALEAGTRNGHGIAGLHAALVYAKELGMDVMREREIMLMRRFYDGIKNIDGIKVYGDFTSFVRAPIIALNIRDYDSGEVADQLAEEYGIYTRAGAHCAPLLHQALETTARGAVRFSMSHFNTEDEIDIAILAVKDLSAY